jgi:hypothetical protein
MARIDEKDKKKGKAKQEESLGGAARSFIEALGFLIILVVLVIAAVLISTYFTSIKKTSTTDTAVVVEKPVAKLPWDIPLYAGSVLTRYTKSGSTAIYEYDLPQGSLASVQKFYQDKFAPTDWTRQPMSSQYVSQYIAGDRTLTITLVYRSASVHMKLQIVTKKS